MANKFCNFCVQDCDEFISTKKEELLNLMIEALPACHFPAKRHRLDCLYYLIVHVTKVMIILLWIILRCLRFLQILTGFREVFNSLLHSTG